MKTKSIEQSLGADLSRKLFTLLLLSGILSICLIFLLNYSKKEIIEKTTSDALYYSLQKGVVERDFVDVTKTIKIFEQANKKVKFCIWLNNTESLIAEVQSCDLKKSRQYSIPFSDDLLSIQIKSDPQFSYSILLPIFLFGMAASFLTKNIKRQTVKISNEIKNIDKAGYDFSFLEMQLVNKQISAAQQLMLHEKISKMALQVAHDIRAPLAVLEQTISSQNPEYDKKMILQATKRIQSISENLLNFNKNENVSKMTQQKQVSLQAVVKKMIGEKTHLSQAMQILFLPQSGIQNIFLAPKTNLSDLERILSNLIDNSLQAMANSKSGEIKIFLNNEAKGQVEIKVEDNGKGIPANVLPKLCEKGFSFGKNDGNGLGLYHAQKTVEDWGGEFKIESHVGTGTTVSFTVPVIEAPAYSAINLTIQSHKHIVILDDDQLIINSWQNRLTNTQDFFGEITAFTKIEDFENWLAQQGDNKNFTLLCDFDLGDQNTFGLDVITKYNLQSQSILVTGRADDAEIQQRVAELGTKLLPKDWIADIEIEVLATDSKINEHTAVLIDDDELIRSLWQNKARAKNISLVCYESSEAFVTNIAKHPASTAIYVDSDLKGRRGEDFIKQLATNGFINVTLTTGYPESKFQNMPWITRVIDKSPPW